MKMSVREARHLLDPERDLLPRPVRTCLEPGRGGTNELNENYKEKPTCCALGVSVGHFREV